MIYLFSLKHSVVIVEVSTCIWTLVHGDFFLIMHKHCGVLVSYK